MHAINYTMDTFENERETLMKNLLNSVKQVILWSFLVIYICFVDLKIVY